jgi:hypothetical protein
MPPPTPKLFSYFLLFPFLLNHPLHRLFPSLSPKSLCLLSPTFGSQQIPSFWIWGKKGGNCSPAQQPLCTLLYRCQMHYGTYLLVDWWPGAILSYECTTQWKILSIMMPCCCWLLEVLCWVVMTSTKISWLLCTTFSLDSRQLSSYSHMLL